MDRVRPLISTADLKKLLLSLRQERPDICLRYRLLGELWNTQFMVVTLVSGNGVVLYDEHHRRFSTVSDISNIMQFEIDEPFHGYQPHFHYEVQPHP
jgi:hypothetical protein